MWVAGIGAAAAVAGAAVSVSGALSKPKGAAGGGASGFPSYPANAFTPINNVNYDPNQIGSDLKSVYPSLQGVAGQATAYATKQREKIMPGAANQLALGSGVIQSYLRGQVPQDVQDQTLRAVAQRSGGGNNPFNGGGLATSDFARSIGQNSLGITNMGLSAAPVWQQLAQSFVAKPQDFSGLALGLGQQRYAYDALNSNIDQFNSTGVATQATGQYNAGVNQWQAGQLQQQYGAQQAASLGNTVIQGANAAANLYGAYRGNGSQIGSQARAGFGGTPSNDDSLIYRGIQEAYTT